MKKGDVIASWVHDGETKHKLQLLCAKMGYVFADWDRSIDNVDEVRAALSASQPTMVVTNPSISVGNIDCLKLLRVAVPELYHHVGGSSVLHSHSFPSLKFVVNTANEKQKGFTRLITLKAFEDPDVGVRGREAEHKVKDSDPLFVKVSKKGAFQIEAARAKTHKEVWEDREVWPGVSKLVRAEYQEMWEHEEVDYQKLKAITGMEYPDPRTVSFDHVLAAIHTQQVPPLPEHIQLTQDELRVGREIRHDLLSMLEHFEMSDGGRMFSLLVAKFPQLNQPEQAERLGWATMHPSSWQHELQAEA
jgi:hypothetical protein